MAGFLAFVVTLYATATAQDTVEISSVSTRPDMVSGGDVLVRIDLPEQVQPVPST